MPPKNDEKTAVKKDYSAYTTDQFISELEASTKAAAENFTLADLAVKECDSLKKELLKSEETLDSVNDQLHNAIEKQLELQSTNDELNTEVAKLKSALTKSEDANPNRKLSFEFEGKEYEIICGANVPGIGQPSDKLTPLEIQSSPEAQAILIKIGSGVIRELK